MTASTNRARDRQAGDRLGPQPKSSRSNSLSLTPMIDVTFLLLIFFLISFEMRPAEGMIPSSLPGDGPGDRRPIRLALQPAAEGGVLYDCNHVQTSDAGQLFRSLQQTRSARHGADSTPVVIAAAGDVEWRYVVEAFNASVRAGFRNVSFAGH